jgi:hypothetical protein
VDDVSGRRGWTTSISGSRGYRGRRRVTALGGRRRSAAVIGRPVGGGGRGCGGGGQHGGAWKRAHWRRAGGDMRAAGAGAACGRRAGGAGAAGSSDGAAGSTGDVRAGASGQGSTAARRWRGRRETERKKKGARRWLFRITPVGWRRGRQELFNRRRPMRGPTGVT